MKDKESTNKTHCILLAGGIGSRFGADVPKQFVEIDGIPIIVYTLKKLQIVAIDDITIVCIESWIPFMKGLLSQYCIGKVLHIVPGGQTGHQSISIGLNAIQTIANPDDIVIIHDAIRPLLPEKVIIDAIDKANNFGCGCAALNSIEGLVIKDDETHGTAMADRYNIVRIQTPQAYRYGTIKALYDKAHDEGREYPYADGCWLANNLPLYFSRSFTANTKITTKPDMAFLKAMMQFSDEELLGETV